MAGHRFDVVGARPSRHERVRHPAAQPTSEAIDGHQGKAAPERDKKTARSGQMKSSWNSGIAANRLINGESA
jgi:hypothetical protein